MMPNINLFTFKGLNSSAVNPSPFEIKPLGSFSLVHHRTPAQNVRFPATISTHNIERKIGLKVHSVNSNEESIIEEDDENCPVDCVREFMTDEEFIIFLEKSKKSGSLVVVDFFRNSCGSCKYIEKGFVKLCKGSGDQHAQIIFLKHNVSLITHHLFICQYFSLTMTLITLCS